MKNSPESHHLMRHHLFKKLIHPKKSTESTTPSRNARNSQEIQETHDQLARNPLEQNELKKLSSNLQDIQETKNESKF